MVAVSPLSPTITLVAASHPSLSSRPSRQVRLCTPKKPSATAATTTAAATVRKPCGPHRVFFLDVRPICYDGSTPSLHSFARWMSLFFSEVSLRQPLVAVLDGDGGSEYRKKLLPSYKAHRTKAFRGGSHSTELVVSDVLRRCHVPVVKVNGCEADDVVATLTDKALKRGLRVVIGSPDKDFKQLLSEDVQMVMPLPEIGRWSFYTLKHYVAQYNCSPSSDLSLRSILGDQVDGVPGIQHVAPAFGRKTALKLLKRHASLDNLLDAAAVRTVGRDYAQQALTQHADYLRKNYQVLRLRTDVEVDLEESWLLERDSSHDSSELAELVRKLDLVNNGRRKVYYPRQALIM